MVWALEEEIQVVIEVCYSNKGGSGCVNSPLARKLRVEVNGAPG